MKEKAKKALKRMLSVMAAAAMAFSAISFVPGGTAIAEAGQNQKVVKITPVNCRNVQKILPEPTKHYPPGQTSENFSYVFKITLAEASKLRITGLARYTFWNWNGMVKYKLTNSLMYADATFTETWSTAVYADHSWEERAENYCDKLFTLNKGTYYLLVSTDLAADWREQTFWDKTISDYPLGLWLSVNKTAYTKTPVLKTIKNSADGTAKMTYTKVPDAKGYQVQYSASRKFASAKLASAKKGGTVVKKLRKGRTYYFRVRAYRTISGKKYWGAWSNVKSIKIRK